MEDLIEMVKRNLRTKPIKEVVKIFNKIGDLGSYREWSIYPVDRLEEIYSPLELVGLSLNRCVWLECPTIDDAEWFFEWEGDLIIYNTETLTKELLNDDGLIKRAIEKVCEDAIRRINNEKSGH